MKLITSLGAGALAVGLALVATGCGSQSAAPPQGSPNTTASPGATNGSPQPCPSLMAATSAHGSSGAILSFAEMHTATVVVDSGSGTATCTVLKSGATVHLIVGQRVEFVANYRPTVTGVPSGAADGTVSVATAPGPTSTGPDSALKTAHVVVTVTAVRPGTVKLAWVDCSGTAC